MTKEKKEAKKGEEGEVPEGFEEAVNEFYESSDLIFRCFDDIYSDYLRGKDVRGDLKAFMNLKRRDFSLIEDVLSTEERIKKWLAKTGIEKEKSDKLFEFKKRFSDLEFEIIASLLEDYGFSNHWSNISSENTFKYGWPTIELKIFAGRKEILYLKNTSTSVYNLVRAMQLKVKGCLDEIKDKNILESEIKMIKEIATDVQKGAKEILEMSEEMEKKGKKK